MAITTISAGDATKLTRSGDTSKTSVGSYAVKFTPKTGYCWPDGTNYLAFTEGVVCDVTANFDAAEG